MVAKYILTTLALAAHTAILPVYLMVHGIRGLYLSLALAVEDWQDSNNMIRRRILYGRDESN
jgi:hypothetical protein